MQHTTVWFIQQCGLSICYNSWRSTAFNGTDESISGHTLKSQNKKLPALMHESLFSIRKVCRRVSTFSIWSASRRSLASLRLGLNVSISSSVLVAAPCLEFTSSLVVIWEYKTFIRYPYSLKKRRRETLKKHWNWVGSEILTLSIYSSTLNN